MSYDEFAEQESGGGITDFQFTVTNAFFAIDEKYSAASGADTHFLHWEGTSDVEGHEVMDRDGFHPKWALDPDWMTMDGGKTVKSQSGKAKLGKAAGRMMGAAANAVLEAGLKDSPDNPLNGPPGMSRIAETWVGTTWFISEVTKDFNNGMVANDDLPIRYIGKGVAVAAAPAPADTAPVAAAPVAAVPDAPAAPDARAQVVALAGSIGDHAAFVTSAMGLPGVASDAVLVAEIVAPGPEGLWGQAQG